MESDYDANYSAETEFIPASELMQHIENAPRHIVLAIKFGLVVLGWGLEHYYYYAVYSGGYETTGLWGVQSSGKSNRCLQHLYWIYRFRYFIDHNIVKIDYSYLPTGVPFLYDQEKIDYFTDICNQIIAYRLNENQEYEIWEDVLDRGLVFKPNKLVEKLEEVPDDDVLPGIGWDDILVHYPSSMFKTDIKQYEAIDSSWAAIRTKTSCIDVTLPNIGRLAKNVKDNCTFEVFLGRNQMEMVKRIFPLPSLNSMSTNLFKVTIERPGIFNIFKVPEWVWRIYWERRIVLTKEALKRLKGVTDPDDLEGLTPVLDVAEMLGISPNTIQQMVSRGVIKGRKVKGILLIEDEYVPRLESLYSGENAMSKSRGRKKA